jgi:hypothetical protein
MGCGIPAKPAHLNGLRSFVVLQTSPAEIVDISKRSFMTVKVSLQQDI